MRHEDAPLVDVGKAAHMQSLNNGVDARFAANHVDLDGFTGGGGVVRVGGVRRWGDCGEEGGVTEVWGGWGDRRMGRRRDAGMRGGVYFETWSVLKECNQIGTINYAMQRTSLVTFTSSKPSDTIWAWRGWERR